MKKEVISMHIKYAGYEKKPRSINKYISEAK
jgi:hypothetical protein